VPRPVASFNTGCAWSRRVIACVSTFWAELIRASAACAMRSVAGSGLGGYSMVGRSHDLRHSQLGWVSMRSLRTASQPARAGSDLACSSRLHGVRRGWVLSTFRSSGPWAGRRPRARASSPPSSDALLNPIERESVPPSRTCPAPGGRARASARALSLAASSQQSREPPGAPRTGNRPTRFGAGRLTATDHLSPPPTLSPARFWLSANSRPRISSSLIASGCKTSQP
jgi:hypothetical protein